MFAVKAMIIGLIGIFSSVRHLANVWYYGMIGKNLMVFSDICQELLLIARKIFRLLFPFIASPAIPSDSRRLKS